MTLHIDYNHKCPKCELPYIPYDTEVACPQCGLLEPDRYDFVSEAAGSALYNLDDQGHYLPCIWAVLSLGDALAWHIFKVLELHRHVDENKMGIRELASIYFYETEFGDSPCMFFPDLGQELSRPRPRATFEDLDFFRQYLVLLCERVLEKVNQMLANGYKVQTDEERRQRRVKWDLGGRGALPQSPALELLDRSEPEGGPVRQPDGTWLAYSLPDGRSIFYHDEDKSYSLVTPAPGRLDFKDIVDLWKYLSDELKG